MNFTHNELLSMEYALERHIAFIEDFIVKIKNENAKRELFHDAVVTQQALDKVRKLKINK